MPNVYRSWPETSSWSFSTRTTSFADQVTERCLCSPDTNGVTRSAGWKDSATRAGRRNKARRRPWHDGTFGEVRSRRLKRDAAPVGALRPTWRQRRSDPAGEVIVLEGCEH